MTNTEQQFGPVDYTVITSPAAVTVWKNRWLKQIVRSARNAGSEVTEITRLLRNIRAASLGTGCLRTHRSP